MLSGVKKISMAIFIDFNGIKPMVWSFDMNGIYVKHIGSRDAGSNVKRRGQPFQKGTCFSAIIFLGCNIR
jgi:hypothetical protein